MEGGKQSLREMPAGMRKIVAVLCLCIALVMLIFIIDKAITNIGLARGSNEAAAWITGKKAYHSKTGYKYYVGYTFEIDGKEYQRTWLYGLFNTKTQVTKQEFDAVDTGTDIKVIYPADNPKINRPKDMGSDQSYVVWQVLGVLVFGAIGINEIRLMITRPRET